MGLGLVVPVYQLCWMFFDNIMHMLDSNSSVDMVYLDFSKAFDKVDHDILLHKIRAVGIMGNIGIWLLVNERLEICSLLLDQFNSVFTSPITNMIVHDPVSFFSCQSLNPDECLTDIEITEQIIIDSIQELSSTSAVGPDVPSSRLLKCAAELAPALKLMFSQSLTHGFIPSSSSNQVPKLPHLIIGQYHSLLPLLKSLSELLENK